ncbi:hypothetical protein CR513_31378, partial [Mucuna pruriens]
MILFHLSNLNYSLVFFDFFPGPMFAEKHNTFQFLIFVKGKDLWGHIDDNTSTPNREQDNIIHAK